MHTSDRLAIRAVAGELRVHTATVWRWILTGVRGRRLRSIHVGGRRYVRRADLDAFLADDESTARHDTPTRDRARLAGAALDDLLG